MLDEEPDLLSKLHHHFVAYKLNAPLAHQQIIVSITTNATTTLHKQ